jgi:3-hydroxyacyl-CoA dehydrogenase
MTASCSPRACSARRGPTANTAGTTISDEGDVRVWTLDGEVLIASIHSKMHAISPEVARACSRRSSWPKPNTRAW